MDYAAKLYLKLKYEYQHKCQMYEKVLYMYMMVDVMQWVSILQ